ncbi:hypothetical protein Q8W71_01660 [Methylobacterium sp. NEAU 140]|uniref:hypothetical protein n=1 Tax=Methylobacterium sp. NEAU 140 TaxID=3064945 RepID=UPI002732A3B0|nr:hypothetical protein [Methylobacterium sp. NEAU 140]MDP4021315.1 hypothetical protein [Methylobacterium sp. NEAU 140]
MPVGALSAEAVGNSVHLLDGRHIVLPARRQGFYKAFVSGDLIDMPDALLPIRSWIDTKQRRHNFYCTSTNDYVQETAIFYLCVSQFKVDRRKKQASFLKLWFIDGQIPASLTGNGYLSEVNVGSSTREAGAARVDTAIGAVGRTFADKVANHGGGLRGFGSALAQKVGTSTALDPEMFDPLIEDTMVGFKGSTGFKAYNPDQAKQPNGAFSAQVQILAKNLKENGFDPANLGLY